MTFHPVSLRASQEITLSPLRGVILIAMHHFPIVERNKRNPNSTRENRERFRTRRINAVLRRSIPYIGLRFFCRPFLLYLSLLSFSISPSLQRYVRVPTYEGRYGARRSSRRPYATLLFSGGQIILGPRWQRRWRCALDADSPRAVADAGALPFSSAG